MQTHKQLIRESKPERVSSGVDGLDRVIEGGFPSDSVILVAGNSGSGKTIFSTEFLYEGLKRGEKTAYISFCESKEQFFSNMKRFGLDLQRFERKRLFKYMDFTTVRKDLGGKVIESIIKTLTQLGIKRVAFDSITALMMYVDQYESRLFLHSIIDKLAKGFGITTLLIEEVPYGESKIGNGFEEFVADGVLFLKHRSQNNEKNTIEIAKMRGTNIEHSTLEYLIDEKDGGIGIISLPKSFESEIVSNERITTGISGLDKMLEGGIYKQSATILEGPEGVGKTIATLQCLTTNARNGETSLYISFEESKSQICRLLDNFGIDYQKLESRFILETFLPEWLTPMHYYRILSEFIEKYNPSILALDSVTALHQTMNESDFRSLMRYIRILCKNKGLTVILTATKGTWIKSTKSGGVSFLSDNLFEMRHYENKNGLEKEILVVKCRGSAHEKRAIHFEIKRDGIHVNS